MPRALLGHSRDTSGPGGGHHVRGWEVEEGTPPPGQRKAAGGSVPSSLCITLPPGPVSHSREFRLHPESQASLARAWHCQFPNRVCHTHTDAVIGDLIMMCQPQVNEDTHDEIESFCCPKITTFHLDLVAWGWKLDPCEVACSRWNCHGIDRC